MHRATTTATSYHLLSFNSIVSNAQSNHHCHLLPPLTICYPSLASLAMHRATTTATSYHLLPPLPPVTTSYHLLSSDLTWIDFLTTVQTKLVSILRVLIPNAVQAIVRSLNLPKHVETCTISIKPESETIKVELKCRYNILKVQHVPVIAWESMELQIGQDSNPLNRFNALVKQFNDALSHHPNLVTSCTVALSFVIPHQGTAPPGYPAGCYSIHELLVSLEALGKRDDPKKERRTEMLLQAGEFQDYHVEVEAQVTFNVKDWKSILAFAGSSSQPLMVKFEKAGRPVVFEASKDGILHAHFVLSTVMPLGSNPQLERQGIDGELTITKNMGAKYKKNMNIFEGLERKRAEFLRNKQNVCNEKPSTSLNKAGCEGSSEKLAIQDSLAFLNSNESAVELLNEWLPNTGGVELNKQLSAKPTTSKTVHDEQDKDETFVQIVYSEENGSRTTRLNADPRQDRLCKTDPAGGYHNTLQTNLAKEVKCSARNRKRHKTVSEPIQEKNIKLSQKLKQVFRLCFDEPFDVTKVPGYDIVLAEDSDIENG
uniref:Uncharacterized protein n=1 Tax=Timema poppense TaxID=170557 RepID=A0A7R9DCR7_TIMPO|nr:unnamed protein product [Timema poppensis]